MMSRLPLVALGGTFDNLHRGHEALLKGAFRLGDTVIVGVTSDDFVRRSGKTGIQQFNQRQGQVKAFLILHGLFCRTNLITLDDAFGPTTSDPEIKALVVTAGTADRAAEVNRIREGKGLPLLSIHIIPYVMAADGRPISSTRIRNKEVDSKGNLTGIHPSTQ
jgi:pantetheine-phosphate adenylyltransferase